ncbi:MAG: glycosyltransferase family 4 protein [Ekhidna sp.]
MKIAMILDMDFPPDARVENEARSLAKDGHDIHLFSLCYKSFEVDLEDFGFLTIHRFKASWLIYKFSALAYDLPFYKWLVKPKIRSFLRQVNPDAIHVHDMVIAESILEATGKMDLVKILDLHENRPEIMEYYPHTKKIPGSLLINLNRWRRAQFDLIKNFDRVVVVTEEAKNYYAKQIPINDSKFLVVPNTLHPDVFKVEDQDQEKKYDSFFTILYIGNTGIRRGTLLALESLRLIKEQIPRVKLLLVGASSEDQTLKTYAEDNSLLDLVDFCGWMPPESLPAYIAASDVCISPLKRNLHHDTTFANKIFQYMAIGKPILVSDCPPQKRIAEENKCGLVHEADSVADFAEKVIALYNNGKGRIEMGENGKNAVMLSLNFESTSRDLRDFYLSSDSKS